jgi:hypothetical protein
MGDLRSPNAEYFLRRLIATKISTAPGGTRDGGENAGGKAPGGLGVASADGGIKSSHIDFGGGSAAAKKAKKDSSERRRSRKGSKEAAPDGR